jgi:pimeloyl-ACP methyl ester carboxylesterase
MSYLPIIYLRGYAAFQSEINATVDDPFYGFNLGSTHIRVGPKGSPERFYFEGPLVRLITDYGYSDTYYDGKVDLSPSIEGEDKLKTIWVYRYYDSASDTLDLKPERWSIEESAEGLRELVTRVKLATGSQKVHLVAHSMGGLVCRSLIQKIYPDHGEEASKHIARLFTYGTPHGGIKFRKGLGVLEWLRDKLGAYSSDDFGIDRMYAYLTPKADLKDTTPVDFEPARIPPGRFDPDNIFCAIGTNANDYEVAAGAAKTAVGPQSDGLVQIGTAYVKNSHRAYIHRSHSGRYGLVNSEEAFQNLERFLFGDILAEILLEGIGNLSSPAEISWQLDVRASVRALPVFMSEQTQAHYCPILLNGKGDQPVPKHPLFTQFLNSKLLAKDKKASQFGITLAVTGYKVTKGKLDLSENLHGASDWSDTLIVNIILGNEPCLEYQWAQTAEPMQKTYLKRTNDDGWHAEVPLPAGKAQVTLGQYARLVINAWDWTL